MADAFSITTASGTIELDANLQGSASFSVTNVSGQVLRARADVVAEPVAAESLVAAGPREKAAPSSGPPPPEATWFAIAGQAERSFPVGGTEVYRVNVTVPASAAPPPAAPPRRYRFRLDVLGTDNPDEDQAQGQWVEFTVNPQVAPPRRIPWLWIIVAAVAALVVIAGVVVTVVVLTHRQGTLTPSTSTVNFGTVAIGTPATQAITVKDTGPVATTVNATVSGAHGTDFTLKPAACLGHTLDPNASCVLEVTFTPAAAGSVVGSLQITGDHAATSTVALTGTGGNPIATAPPFTLTFFNRDQGFNWSGTATITNTGTTPLHVTAAAVNLSIPPFALQNVDIGNFCSNPVAPGKSCTISVTLRLSNLVITQTNPTPPAGTLTVTSDAGRLQIPFT